MKDALIIAAAAATGAGIGDGLETHGISLGTAFAVAGVVLPAAWWLSRKLQRLEDSVDSLDKKIQDLECVRSRKCDYET